LMAELTDKRENQPESKQDVVETKAAVIVSFINDVIRKEMPNCAYVYDPDLSYETGMQLLRDNNNSGQAVQDGQELFIYRVTSLRYPDETQAPNMRSSQNTGKIRLSDGKSAVYSAVHAEFDIEYMYVVPSMEEAQRFEVVFMSEDGISGTTDVQARMGELGDFHYYLSWEKLLDNTVNSNDNYYKAYASLVKVRGFFFVFRGESKIITEIKSKVNSYVFLTGDGQNLGTTSVK
jgi:hypothetical protein